MHKTLQYCGFGVILILVVMTGHFVTTTIEAARMQARRVQVKHNIVLGGGARIVDPIPADATNPENAP